MDYAISDVEFFENETLINLERKGMMPMPLDVLVEFEDGSQEFYYIPITLMRGEKANPYSLPWKVEKDWSWSNPKYTLTIPNKTKKIKLITIDPSFYMADLDRKNNSYFKK